jgi:phosphate-selective porin OprO/OprP
MVWIAIPSVCMAQAAPSNPPTTVSAGQDGFIIQSGRGDFRLQIGLLLQADGRFAFSDTDDQVIDTFVFRRLRPYLRGRFARRFEFYFNPDFAGGDLVVQDAYVDTVFAPAFRVRAGKGKTPFGMERLQSASNLLFIGRALSSALVPNRDIGIQVLGDISGGVVSYLAGVMNGVPDGGSGDIDNNDGKDVSGRLVVRPFIRHAASRLHGLGVAISASAGPQSGYLALPVFRTPSLQQIFFVYAATSAADGTRTRYSPQLFYFHKSFGGWADYVHTNTPIAKNGVRDEISHDGWQVAGSWVLTGEAATDAPAGIRPRRPFDFEGGLGTFQVAVRYHALQVDEEALTLEFASPSSSREAQAWTVGLNWYLTVNFRYTFNFERTVFDGDPNGPRKAEDGFVFRTQVNF